jgi:hypothetical protein
MKTLLALAFVVAGIAAATATASPNTTTTTYRGWTVISYPANTQGYRFTTDTLGGNWHARHEASQGITFITDTLGGNGHPKTTPVQGYRFITDTLAPGGGRSVDLIASSTGFSWTDAGVGAGAGVGALLLLTGTTLLVLRRRGQLAI